MHPVIFIGAFLLVGLLFALQEWISVRMWYTKMAAEVSIPTLLGAWEFYYLLLGVACWLLWFQLGPRLLHLDWLYIVTRILPLSIVISVGVEMAWVACFPKLPISRNPLSYWRRLSFELGSEFLGNLITFWTSILIFQVIGYYEEVKDKEKSLSQLELELARTQIHALRMQINPHFLFNSLNSISSLMRTDVTSADTMLEQLSSLFRISLERGDTQMIRVSEEMDFIGIYLELQGQRFKGRVRQEILVEPQTYDALVPAMLLQPLVENAYVHGLCHLTSGGKLAINLRKQDHTLDISIRNNGADEERKGARARVRVGIGLENVHSRLKLHFKENYRFLAAEVAPDEFCVDISIPLTYATSDRSVEEEKVTR
jgi:two-component system LytT family sensor kinase